MLFLLLAALPLAAAPRQVEFGGDGKLDLLIGAARAGMRLEE